MIRLQVQGQRVEGLCELRHESRARPHQSRGGTGRALQGQLRVSLLSSLQTARCGGQTLRSLPGADGPPIQPDRDDQQLYGGGSEDRVRGGHGFRWLVGREASQR